MKIGLNLYLKMLTMIENKQYEDVIKEFGDGNIVFVEDEIGKSYEIKEKIQKESKVVLTNEEKAYLKEISSKRMTSLISGNEIMTSEAKEADDTLKWSLVGISIDEKKELESIATDDLLDKNRSRLELSNVVLSANEYIELWHKLREEGRDRNAATEELSEYLVGVTSEEYESIINKSKETTEGLFGDKVPTSESMDAEMILSLEDQLIKGYGDPLTYTQVLDEKNKEKTFKKADFSGITAEKNSGSIIKELNANEKASEPLIK